MTALLLDLDRPVVQKYLGYLRARNRVWWAKEHGREPDYRGDDVLRQYHFCNIWRERDRFSKEEVQRIRGLDLPDQVRLIGLGRFSLSWPTTDLLLRGGRARILENRLREHWADCVARGRREEFVSNAISFYPRPGLDRASQLLAFRAEFMPRVPHLVQIARDRTVSGEDLIKAIARGLSRVGQFKAYEVYTSLTYCEELDWRGENDVIIVGPGAKAGLAYVTGLEAIKPKDYTWLVPQLRDEVTEQLRADPEWRWIPGPLQGNATKVRHKFTNRTLEDSLCEFRKYEHLTLGRGRRRKYQGER